MILTERYLNYLRKNNYICSRLTNAQAEELLKAFGQEPHPEPPFFWDEETIWHTIRKMTHL